MARYICVTAVLVASVGSRDSTMGGRDSTMGGGDSKMGSGDSTMIVYRQQDLSF